MPATLSAANAEEIHDLITWLDDHPAEIIKGVRDEAAEWLLTFVNNTNAYPAFIAVPERLVEVIYEVINDWSEVMSSHNESLLTELKVNQ